jgi:dTDP-4-amino-4,6-dideoxygalactose transaminase
MDAILNLAHRHGLRIVEDCAQAHGARTLGRPVGTLGDLGCFSFYPTKNLGAAGDGGLVLSRDPELARRVRLLRQYGWRQRYISDVPGLNSRLDEVQAALLRVKLRHLEAGNRRRRQLAQHYDKLLAGSGVQVPAVTAGNEHVYHLYVVRSRQRDRLQAHLANHGIASAIHYPLPVHRQPAYRHLAPPEERLACTDQVAAEILSLPMYPQLALDDVARIAACIRELPA